MRTITINELVDLRERLIQIDELVGGRKGPTLDIDNALFQLGSISIVLETLIAKEVDVIEEYERSLAG
jgi:hypothetical protein